MNTRCVAHFENLPHPLDAQKTQAETAGEKLWTDASSREFIAAEYPWFLDTFDGYDHNIQRADAIRYFVLAHFGGIYIDLDDVSIIPTP